MEEIFKKGREDVYVRGDVVDIPHDEIRYIESGVIALYSIDDKQRNFLLAYIERQIFPFSKEQHTLFSGRKIEYRAFFPSKTYALKRVDFEAEAFKPENVKQLFDNLLKTMEYKLERIDNLSQNSVMQRLLERINYYAERVGVVRGDKIVIEVPISHSDIASSIGATRETVNRLMRKLEKQGVASLKKNTIVIHSRSKLHDMIVHHAGKKIYLTLGSFSHFFGTFL